MICGARISSARLTPTKYHCFLVAHLFVAPNDAADNDLVEMALLLLAFAAGLRQEINYFAECARNTIRQRRVPFFDDLIYATREDDK